MIQAFCAYTGLLNTLTCLALAAFIFLRNPKGKINRVFSLFSVAVAFWSLGYFLWLFMGSYASALLCTRILMSGAIIIPTAFLHFSLVYLKLDDDHKGLIRGCYVFSAIYLLLNFTPLLIERVETRYWFRWWPVPGALCHLFIGYFFLAVLYGHYLLFKQSFVEKKEETRKQIRAVAIGTLIGYLGGSTNFFLWYNIPIPPVFNVLVTSYVAFVAYAIVHYRLMNIEVFIKKTLVFAGLLTFVFGVFSAATFAVRAIVSQLLGFNTDWSFGISLFLIVLGYDHIRSLLINLTDNYLFQKKYDYQKFLKEASRGMSRIKSLEHLLNLVVHFVTAKMRVENAGVLMRTLKGDFSLQYQRGYRDHADHSHITWDHPLIQYFTVTKEAIDIEQAKDRHANPDVKIKGKGQSVEFAYDQIRTKMEEMKASCCIPSFLGQELRNILVLGAKKSGDYFTEEDHNVLLTLAQESAIAIENARLYDEQVNKTRELEKINTQLESAKGSLLGALQETELANKRLQDTQAQLIHEQKMATLGRLAASVGHEVNNPLTILSMNVSRAILKYRKNPEAKIFEILEIFTKMEQNINRIKAVVNTLTGLLKKSEKGKFEPLSLKLILEETLPLVQFQTYLDNLAGTEVEFIVPGSIPLIRGDLERLQEVFLNLFINAYHAMEGRPNPKITVTADVDAENKFVGIHFTDTGKGMTEETAKRIFNYGFTTKPAGKGSGLGLYMCKYIIELHGGDIKVTSEVDVGTTFTLTLPVFEESGTVFSEQETRTV